MMHIRTDRRKKTRKSEPSGPKTLCPALCRRSRLAGALYPLSTDECPERSADRVAHMPDALPAMETLPGTAVVSTRSGRLARAASSPPGCRCRLANHGSRVSGQDPAEDLSCFAVRASDRVPVDVHGHLGRGVAEPFAHRRDRHTGGDQLRRREVAKVMEPTFHARDPQPCAASAG